MNQANRQQNCILNNQPTCRQKHHVKWWKTEKKNTNC